MAAHVSSQFFNTLSTYPINLHFDLDDALANFDDYPSSAGDRTTAASMVADREALSVSLVSDMPTVTGSDDDCAVCMERFHSAETAKRVPCGHVYHATCISSWLSLCDSCPLCRRSISGDVVHR